MKLVLNPLTGLFDFTGTDSASSLPPELIPPGSTLDIPDGQQLLIHHFLEVQGTLTIEGLLSIIEADTDYGYPEQILPSEIYDIPIRRQVVVQDFIDNQGLIENFGLLIIQ